MEMVQQVVGIELETRYGIGLEEHQALFDAIWQNVEAKIVEDKDLTYAELLLCDYESMKEYEEALDVVVAAVEENPLFQYFFRSGQAD